MSQDLTEIEVEGVGIMRLPSMWHWERIKAMPRGPNKAIAPAAFGLGMTIRQFKRLPAEKQREVIQAYYKLTEPPIPEVRPEDARRRIPRKNERVPEERMIELGRELLAIKARLPKGHFMPWIEEKSGIAYTAAMRFMRAAKEADRQEAAAKDRPNGLM